MRNFEKFSQFKFNLKLLRIHSLLLDRYKNIIIIMVMIRSLLLINHSFFTIEKFKLKNKIDSDISNRTKEKINTGHNNGGLDQ